MIIGWQQTVKLFKILLFRISNFFDNFVSNEFIFSPKVIKFSFFELPEDASEFPIQAFETSTDPLLLLIVSVPNTDN